MIFFTLKPKKIIIVNLIKCLHVQRIKHFNKSMYISTYLPLIIYTFSSNSNNNCNNSKWSIDQFYTL